MSDVNPSLFKLGMNYTDSLFNNGNGFEIGAYFIIRKDRNADSPGIPVKITGGYYRASNYPYGVSNYWHWQQVNADGSLGEKGGDYGRRYPFSEKIDRRKAIRLAKKLSSDSL